MTLEDALKSWEEAGKHGSVWDRLERGKRWLPYYAYLAGRQDTEAYELPEKQDEFVARLLEDGAVRPGDTVLDIGAGMGTYALEFARAGCRVTALDASAEALAVLQKRAEKCGLSEKIETIFCSWEEYQPQRRYDLTFSSLCPAICDYTQLQRMEAMTKGSCCLVTVARGSVDRHRKAMMAGLGIKPAGGMVTEALHYMNVLYLSGRLFRMISRSTASTRKISERSVLEQYPIYFRIFGVEEDVSVPFLKDYLARHAEGGFLSEESRMNLAMLYWSESASQ